MKQSLPVSTRINQLLVLLVSVLYAATGRTEVWADVRDNVFTSNSVYACTECHSYLKTIASASSDPLSRHAASSGVDFDAATDLAAYNTVTSVNTDVGGVYNDTEANQMVAYGFGDATLDRIYEWAAHFAATGYMPMDPTADTTPADGVIDDFTDAADLNTTEKNTLMNWAVEGAPYAAAVATTGAASSISKTGATLNATITPNVHSGTAVPGTANFEYGVDTGYGATTTVITSLTGTSGAAQATIISGLSCGTTYHFRAVATNGAGTNTGGTGVVNGSDNSFNTSACTAPVITEGASISPAATNEDTATTFTLNVTDDDPGTLTWSVQTQGSKGTFSFDTSTAASPVTVRYTPTADQDNADTAGVIMVTNADTNLSASININMSITPVNDQPSITSTASTSGVEDTLYSYQLVVDDPDDTFAAGLTAVLSNEPAGMSVDGTGLITWTPGNGVASSGLVTVTVSDGGEDGTVADTQQFTVTVSATNDPPVITPGATTTATEDILYSYQVQVTDVDDTNNGTDIIFTPSNFPAGMSISSTGLITWTPLEGVTTSGLVTVAVEDGNEDVSPPDTESFTINVTQVNDAPVITPGATTAAVEGDNYSYQIVVNDDDDLNNGTDLSFTPGNFPAGMTVSTTGLISWAVPRTGTAATHNNITVTVADGGEDGAASTAEAFNLSISITDTDGDLIADYEDNCRLVSNNTQADLDGDTVRTLPQTDPSGYPASGDVNHGALDANGYVTGGDACDEDEDGDGIPDTIENSFAFLDERNPADAVLDEDGDGLSNLAEYNNDNTGATMSTDSVGPVITAPADITVSATGLLTSVDPGVATATDSNDGEITQFKVAANLSAAQLAAIDNTGGCSELSQYNISLEPLRSGSHTITWITCDSSGNSSRAEQKIQVKPLVSVSSGQYAGEGTSVRVGVVLNGDAIAYPATVDYSFSGTATAGDDHDGVAGTLTFNSAGDVGEISFNTLSDAIVEFNETIEVTLSTPVNIALGESVTHTVTLTETNLAPQVAFEITQNTLTMGTVIYQPDGNATITAQAEDANGDSLSYDWSATDSGLLAAATQTGNQLDLDPTLLTVGNLYQVAVTVSDGLEQVSIDRLIQVRAAETMVLVNTDDSDGDGLDDLAEGFADSDADGIPDYLDHAATPASAIETHTTSTGNSVLIETNAGLKIHKGETAVAAGSSGTMIGLKDVKDHGGHAGSAANNANTNYTFISSLISIEISGLTDEQTSIDVVIPLSTGIQAGSVYRKYNASGWFDFVEDDLNRLKSARGTDGTCPPAGSARYTNGMTAGDLCLQLTIQDGGANDADGMRNYVVKDPGALALEPVAADTNAVAKAEANANGRIGAVSIWFALLLMMLYVSTYRIRYGY